MYLFICLIYIVNVYIYIYAIYTAEVLVYVNVLWSLVIAPEVVQDLETQSHPRLALASGHLKSGKTTEAEEVTLWCEVKGEIFGKVMCFFCEGEILRKSHVFFWGGVGVSFILPYIYICHCFFKSDPTGTREYAIPPHEMGIWFVNQAVEWATDLVTSQQKRGVYTFEYRYKTHIHTWTFQRVPNGS